MSATQQQQISPDRLIEILKCYTDPCPGGFIEQATDTNGMELCDYPEWGNNSHKNVNMNDVRDLFTCDKSEAFDTELSLLHKNSQHIKIYVDYYTIASKRFLKVSWCYDETQTMDSCNNNGIDQVKASNTNSFFHMCILMSSIF